MGTGASSAAAATSLQSQCGGSSAEDLVRTLEHNVTPDVRAKLLAALQQTQGLPTFAGEFDGTATSAVDMDLSCQLDGDFTIEAEIFMEDPGNDKYKPIISRTTGKENKLCQFDLQIQAGGNICFFMGNGDAGLEGGYGILLMGGQLPPKTWTWVKVTQQDGTYTMWVNSEQKEQGEFKGDRGANCSTNPVRVGAYENESEQFFEGKIRNLLMHGPGFDLMSKHEGPQGFAGEFDGTSSTEVVAELGHLVDDDFTIEAEVFMDDPGNDQYKPIISRTIGENNQFCQFNLQIQAGGNINFFMGNKDTDANGGYGTLLNGGNLEASTWTLIKVESACQKCTLFVNGEEKDSGDFVGDYKANCSKSPVHIGSYTNESHQYFKGRIRGLVMHGPGFDLSVSKDKKDPDPEVAEDDLATRFEKATPQPKTTHWVRWDGEDWTESIGADVIIQKGDGTYLIGKLESTGNAPWDLNIRLEDGSEFYKGGEDNGVVNVRLL